MPMLSRQPVSVGAEVGWSIQAFLSCTWQSLKPSTLCVCLGVAPPHPDRRSVGGSPLDGVAFAFLMGPHHGELPAAVHRAAAAAVTAHTIPTRATTS